MQIDVITIFPGMFRAALGESLLKRARQRKLLRITVHDLRRFTHDKRRTVDDRPYGGGPGMVMKPEPIFEAVDAIRPGRPGRGGRRLSASSEIILMSPAGERLSPGLAQQLARLKQMIIVCGHYEGVDERVRTLADRSISIGDYILTGGELAAMVMVDAVLRLVPGVVGSEDSVAEDSFTTGLLQHPLYTRPQVYRDMEVPPVLLSGNHSEIALWRRRQALLRTLERRPDLLATAELTAEDLEFLRGQGYVQGST